MSATVEDVLIMLFGQSRDIGGIIPDVILEESTHDALVITEHPVEYGAMIADHAFKAPTELSMRVGYSPQSILLNSAISMVAGALGGSTAGTSGAGGITPEKLIGIDSLPEMYRAFLDLQAQREPFDVLTPKRAYKNMLISSLSMTTDNATENALILDVGMREVIITRTQLIDGKPQEQQAMPDKTASPEQAGMKTPAPSSAKNEAAAGAWGAT